MAFCDYDFYANVYLGESISEEDFPRLSARASDYVQGVTKGLAGKVHGDANEAVQKAVCAIAEVLQDEGKMASRAFSDGQAVSSETVGNWSRHYQSASLSGNETQYIEVRKREALELYLGNLPEFAALFGVRSYRCVHRK